MRIKVRGIKETHCREQREEEEEEEEKKEQPERKLTREKTK